MAFVPLDALLDPMFIPIDGVVFAWEMDADQSHEIQPDQIDQLAKIVDGLGVD